MRLKFALRVSLSSGGETSPATSLSIGAGDELRVLDHSERKVTIFIYALGVLWHAKMR